MLKSLRGRNKPIEQVRKLDPSWKCHLHNFFSLLYNFRKIVPKYRQLSLFCKTGEKKQRFLNLLHQNRTQNKRHFLKFRFKLERTVFYKILFSASYRSSKNLNLDTGNRKNQAMKRFMQIVNTLHYLIVVSNKRIQIVLQKNYYFFFTLRNEKAPQFNR